MNAPALIVETVLAAGVVVVGVWGTTRWWFGPGAWRSYLSVRRALRAAPADVALYTPAGDVMLMVDHRRRFEPAVVRWRLNEVVSVSAPGEVGMIAGDVLRLASWPPMMTRIPVGIRARLTDDGELVDLPAPASSAADRLVMAQYLVRTRTILPRRDEVAALLTELATAKPREE